MRSTTVLFVISLLVAVSGCGSPQNDTVIVAVYPSRQQCGVEKEMMTCGEIAAYLRDTAKINPERRVVVSAVGADPLPKNDTSLNKIAATIRALGYTDVRTANFDMK
jgi:hypothetical protein